MRKMLIVLVGALFACGTPVASDDAGPAGQDASVEVDATPQPPEPPLPAIRQILPVSGRASGKSYTMDVQFGRSWSAEKTTGSEHEMRGASAW